MPKTFKKQPVSKHTPVPCGGDACWSCQQALGGRRRFDCTQCHKWTPPGILPKEAWFGKTAKMFGLANNGRPALPCALQVPVAALVEQQEQQRRQQNGGMRQRRGPRAL